MPGRFSHLMSRSEPATVLIADHSAGFALSLELRHRRHSTEYLNLSGFSITRVVLLVGFLWSAAPGKTQSDSARFGASPPRPQSIDQNGYLNKTPASPLRFATPPRPPVPSLLPLTITQDPKPVFSARFVEPTADVTAVPPTAAAPTPDLATSVQWPELVSQITVKGVEIPESPPPKGAIIPQMLARFFIARPTDDRAAQEIEFQLPSAKKVVLAVPEPATANHSTEPMGR